MSKKKVFVQDLRDKTLEEVNVQTEDLRKELYTMRCQRVMDKKAENIHRYKELKKQIAQAMTIVHEKQKSA
ncbi:50S ribosomal protein L29 [Chlamydiales bacterium SCGC AG-110-M15]|nr:50S ribosomal protein L29 [Chlamydiales bacterium SCGC AG-110-M15]